jgi:hypothetical protein
MKRWEGGKKFRLAANFIFCSKKILNLQGQDEVNNIEVHEDQAKKRLAIQAMSMKAANLKIGRFFLILITLTLLYL